MKPVIIVSTLCTKDTKETAVRFVEALHVWHALDISNCHDRRCSDRDAPEARYSQWVVIQKHKTDGTALEYHLALTKDFKNGGSEEEWRQGWESYLDLYNRFFPGKTTETYA